MKDISRSFSQSNLLTIKEITFDFYGDIDEPSFLKDHFIFAQNENYKINEDGHNFSRHELKSYWEKESLIGALDSLFLKRLDTECRLSTSNTLRLNYSPERSPIYKLFKNKKVERKVADYFKYAFNLNLFVNRRGTGEVSIHVGEIENPSNFTIDEEDEYYSHVASLPSLQDQGDGMRSFASILLDLFTTEHCITLIDEPEAFLHPPQARLLGKMFIKNNSNDKQLVIATHSEDFLHGILDTDKENVIIVRIERMGNVNYISTLQKEKIKELWGNPILKYSNILNGLFHKKVIVCESDYDCLFYQAMIDSMCEAEGKNVPDILFTNCGGKSRIKDVVSALRVLRVPVLAICDFDIFDDRRKLRALISAFDLNLEKEIKKDLNIIYDSINSNNNKNVWSILKKNGKAYLEGDTASAYQRVETLCQTVGLYIVPVGEMECFDKTISVNKGAWVYQILERYNLAIEPKLKDVREFLHLIIKTCNVSQLVNDKGMEHSRKIRQYNIRRIIKIVWKKVLALLQLLGLIVVAGWILKKF